MSIGKAFFNQTNHPMDSNVEYVSVDVSLAANVGLASEKISIPDGKVIAIAAIVAGNTENRIINLSVLDNGNEVIKPADVRFSQKTSGGSFKESMRPVNFNGGRNFETKLVANAISTTQAVTVQVLFLIEKTTY